MTYDRGHRPDHEHSLDGAVVSHTAELVRGYFVARREGPLIRPYGAPSPQGEKEVSSAARNVGSPPVAISAG